MGYAVVVTFQIRPGCMDQFMPLMLGNAATSLRDESGCEVFDVATDPGRPNVVFLYERYVDQAAFGVHLGTEHFATFDAATAQMIVAKDIQTFAQVQG